MALIDFFNDVDGKREVSHGSDGRLNVSSRSDTRIYYNSRDLSDSYSVVFDYASATTADYVFYIKNTNTNGKHLVLNIVQLGCASTAAIYKLVTATDTPSGGSALTPSCLNRAAPTAAAVTCPSPANSNSAPMTLTAGVELDIVSGAGAYDHAELHSPDTIRLGQDQALAIELEFAAAADVRTYGAVTFYFE